MKRIPAISPWSSPLAAGIWTTLLLWCIHLLMQFPDDEAVTILLAAEFWQTDPLLGATFLKFRPAVGLLFLPVVGAGMTGVLMLHAVFTGLGVWSLGEASRAVGGSWRLALMVTVASPVWLLCSLTGQTNSLPFTLTAFAAWFLLSKPPSNWMNHPVTALVVGVLTGGMVFMRYEALPIAVALTLIGLLQRRWWFIAGLPLFGLGIYAVGLSWHGQLFWPLLYPPGVNVGDMYARLFAYIGLTPLFFSVVHGVTVLAFPGYLLLVAYPVKHLRTEEKILYGATGLLWLLLFIGPLVRMIDFLHFPRYYMLMVTPAALLLSRLNWSQVRTRTYLVAGAGAAVAVVMAGVGASVRWPFVGLLGLLLPTVSLVSVLIARRSRASSQTLSVIAGCVIVSLSLILWLDNSRRWTNFHPLHGRMTHYDQVLETLRTRVRPGDIVYSRDQMLVLRHWQSGQPLGVPVHFVPTHDITWEIKHLLNHENGQYCRAITAMQTIDWMQAAFLCDFAEDQDLSSSLFVVPEHHLRDRPMLPKFIEQATESVGKVGSLSIFRGKAQQGSAPDLIGAGETYDHARLPCECE